MRTLLLPFILAALVCAGSSASAQSSSEGSSQMQAPKHFKFRKTQEVDVNYLLSLPKGYQAKGKERWPLVLFLHGAGERGTDLSKVAVHGPPKLVKQGQELPFIIVSPQCPDGKVWEDEILLGLLDEVKREHAVDESRIYLTGLSMGGYGTWSLGLKHPEVFAAIAPICGGGELISVLLAQGEKGKALRSLGVWAFHGGKDNVVPPEESERMVNLLKRVGVTDVKLTVYPEANHDSWSQTYSNPEFFQWLLKHRRN